MLNIYLICFLILRSCGLWNVSIHYCHYQGWGFEFFFLWSGSASAEKLDPDPTLIRNEKKYLYILMKNDIYIIVIAVHQ